MAGPNPKLTKQDADSADQIYKQSETEGENTESQNTKSKKNIYTGRTKITHIRKEKAQFLGVQIGCSESHKSKQAQNRREKKKNTTRLAEVGHLPIQRTEGSNQPTEGERIGYVQMWHPQPEISRKEIITKLIQAGFLRKENKKYYIQAISKWISLSHRDILYKYNAIIKDFFVICACVARTHSAGVKTLFREVVGYILRHSCAKTLSRKFRLKNRKGAFQKFGKNLGTPEGEIELAIPKN